MAFPSVVAVTKATYDTVQTSHVINIPPGNLGDLILVFFGAANAPTVTVNTGISGTDWQTSTFVGVTGNFRAGFAYKLATASDSLTFNTTDSERSTYQCYRISGASGVISANAIQDAGTNANPPALTTSWGADDNLWIVAVINTFDDIASAAPADFTDLITEQSTNLEGVSSSTARRNLNAATLDPTNFALGTAIYRVYTLAIQPAPEPTVRIKFWNGSQWVEKPMKMWNGTSWETKTPKYFFDGNWI
jgi:hypothetical protein